MTWNHRLFRLVALTILVSSVAFGAEGPSGESGVAGAEGNRGRSGFIGGLDAMYTWYPLCSLGSLIAAARDEVKLKEFLGAGCSVTEIAPHNKGSMFTYSITRQSPELLALILGDLRAKNEIDIFAEVPNVDVLQGLNASLNPFEVTVYNRLIGRSPVPVFPTEPFSELYVDQNQIEMLKLLLDAANDSTKLRAATQEVILRLKNSRFASHPSVQSAAQLIELRLKQLDQ